MNAAATAHIAQFSGGDVVVAIWMDHGQGYKGLYDLRMTARAGEALKKLLKNQARSNDDFVSKKCLSQGLNLR